MYTRFWARYMRPDLLLASRRAHEVATLARVVTLLWGYRLALWLLPFHWVMRHTERPLAQQRAKKSEQRRLVRRVEQAAWFVPHATCLVRVLVGAHLFAAQGRRADVVIGVRRRAGVLEAHAWLESGGQVILGDVQDLSSYHPLS